jgi:hypothetical protein
LVREPSDRDPGVPPRGRPRTGLRATELLERFVAEYPGERIRMGDLVAAMGPRAFGLMLLVLSLPNMLPVPGISTVFGVPLILFGAQMLLGYPRPWMPRRLAGLELRRAQLSEILDRAAPHLRRAERWLRPRATRLAGLWAERAVGATTLVLGTVLILPLFGGNFLPALAVAVMALGLLERDGVFVALGLGTAVLALAVVGAVLTAFAFGGVRVFDWLRSVLPGFLHPGDTPFEGM